MQRWVSPRARPPNVALVSPALLSLGAVSAFDSVNGSQLIVVPGHARIFVFKRSLAVREARVAPPQVDAFVIGGISKCGGLPAVFAQGLRFWHLKFLTATWPGMY